jgi:pyrroline-5-carboxylate reductase
MKISMIGFGNMGKALCEGLLQHPNYHMHVAAPSMDAQLARARLSVSTNNLAALKNADVLILAVKPAQMANVLTEISPYLPPDLLLISIAAGLDLAWFAHHVPEHTPIVRAMPNLAAAQQQSATPLLANQWVTATQQQWASELFEQCGQTTWLKDEKDLDVITALAGSGLAYLFLFVQAMSDAAVSLGLSPAIAQRFAIQTLAGASSLATLPEQNLQQLQQKITSKAGTTAAALDVFAQQHLSETVRAAMQAAVSRAQTLRSEET